MKDGAAMNGKDTFEKMDQMPDHGDRWIQHPSPTYTTKPNV
jgi:hypothetical protein